LPEIGIGIEIEIRSRSKPASVPGWLGTDYSSMRFALLVVPSWMTSAHRVYGGWCRPWLTRPTIIPRPLPGQPDSLPATSSPPIST